MAALLQRRRNWRKRAWRKKNAFKKKLRSRWQVAKIAQAVVNHNSEVKYQDQAMVGYPKVSLTHNVFEQIFDSLTMTRQGVENQPATNFAQNRVGSSIRPLKLWIKGIIQLNGTPSGFPISKCLLRLIIVRRPISTTIDTGAPALPQGIPKNYAQTSQTNLNTFPNNFLANFDYRACTVVYDKVHSINTTAMTQSQVAPDYAARGNAVSKMFNINLNMDKLCRGSVDYSFTELTTPSGTNIPKKYCFQMYGVPWLNDGYDPTYTQTGPVACSIIAQSRLYFRDG